MKKGNIILAALCILLAIVIIAISSTYPTAESYGTGVPGPGLWPIIISVVMIACSVILLLRTWRLPPEKNTKVDVTGSGPRRVYITMAALVLYVILLQPIGFIIATTALEFAFIKWFSGKGWLVSFLIALAITVVVYFAFQYLLSVPIGSFGIIRL